MLVMAACSNSSFYEANYDLKDQAWRLNDVPEFAFYVEDTSLRYDIDVVMRYGNQYRFQNLYLTRILLDRRGRSLDSTLVNIQLFNDKTGQPLGSGIGDIFTVSQPILTQQKFNRPDTFKIRVRQTMRPDTLRHVVSVGLQVNTSPKE
jgi:gliding motility-associated lipoprotein GldH